MILHTIQEEPLSDLAYGKVTVHRFELLQQYMQAPGYWLSVFPLGRLWTFSTAYLLRFNGDYSTYQRPNANLLSLVQIS